MATFRAYHRRFASFGAPRRRAFTLLEVIVAMAILVTVLMICYEILGSTLEASNQIDRTTRPDKIGEAIMAVIRRDLQGLIWYRRGDDLFRGVDGGEDQNAHDELHFFTTTRPVSMVQGRMGNDQWWTGVASVDYFLRESKELEGAFALLRGENVEILDPPFEDDPCFELYGKMKYLDIQYFDGYEWSDSWDSIERLESYRVEKEAALAQADEEASSVTTRTREESLTGKLGTASAATGSTARTSTTRTTAARTGTTAASGVAGTQATVEGELTPLEPLPEHGVPRMIRIKFGLYVGTEGGLFKESRDANAAEKLYEFSSTIVVPAAAALRVTADVSSLTASAAAGGAGGGGGAVGPDGITVIGASPGGKGGPGGAEKGMGGKSKEEIMKILKEQRGSGGGRAGGGFRPSGSGGRSSGPGARPSGGGGTSGGGAKASSPRK